MPKPMQQKQRQMLLEFLHAVSRLRNPRLVTGLRTTQTCPPHPPKHQVDRKSSRQFRDPYEDREGIIQICVILVVGNPSVSTNDDTSEDQPIIFDNEGYDETQLLEGMKHESKQMKLHDVYDKVDASSFDDNILKEAIPTRWVHRKKGPAVRSRIIAKGYTEKIEDEDSVDASTPMFTTLRTLLALQMSRPNWIARLGDVSTAFLHAPIAKDHDGKQRDVYLWPPKELCPQQDKIWRLKKAMYGLRSSPK